MEHKNCSRSTNRGCAIVRRYSNCVSSTFQLNQFPISSDGGMDSKGAHKSCGSGLIGGRRPDSQKRSSRRTEAKSHSAKSFLLVRGCVWIMMLRIKNYILERSRLLSRRILGVKNMRKKSRWIGHIEWIYFLHMGGRCAIKEKCFFPLCFPIQLSPLDVASGQEAAHKKLCI